MRNSHWEERVCGVEEEPRTVTVCVFQLCPYPDPPYTAKDFVKPLMGRIVTDDGAVLFQFCVLNQIRFIKRFNNLVSVENYPQQT